MNAPFWKIQCLTKLLKIIMLLRMTHELWIDGHHLIEEKQKNLIHTDGSDKTPVLVHIRSIDEKSYKITEINNCDNAAPETQVETDMAEDEVKKFEEACGIRISPKMISRNFIIRTISLDILQVTF